MGIGDAIGALSVVHPVPVGEIRPNTLTVNAKMDGLDLAYRMHDR